jgi:hypothetical protein
MSDIDEGAVLGAIDLLDDPTGPEPPCSKGKF